MVRLLLSYGADANIQDNQGTTALMFACERGHTHIARLLLERSQCDLTLTDKVILLQTSLMKNLLPILSSNPLTRKTILSFVLILTATSARYRLTSVSSMLLFMVNIPKESHVIE